MLKKKEAKQPARSIPPPPALLWRRLLAQLHAALLFSQVQWCQQLFLHLVQGSASAAGHLCQMAPFLCRLCIPASSRKSAGNVIFNPCPPATQREGPVSSPSRMFVHLCWATVSLSLWGGSSSTWLLCRKRTGCRLYLGTVSHWWWKKGGEKSQSYRSVKEEQSQ